MPPKRAVKKITKEKPASAIEAGIEAAGAAIKKARKSVGDVVENAGEMLIDDVAPEPKGRVGRGKKAGVKAVTEAETTPVVEKATAVLKKAGKKVAEVVENVGDMVLDDVSPETKSDTRGIKRKTADDFMSKEVEKKAKEEKKKPKPPKSTPKYQPPPRALKTKAKKVAAPAPAPVEEKMEVEEKAASDEESFIGAFESDDEMGGADSSDDESDAEDEAVRAAAKTVQVSTLPHAKDDKTVAARLKKAAKKRGVERGTIYLGRVPHGFYEDEIKEYFGQFGDVTRYRLARNPKSGASRHYGYVEFSSAPVAEIVAETMHNYLLMGHLLQCVVIPQEEVHPELWVGANKKFKKVPRARVEKVRQDKPRTTEQQERADARLKKREEARREKIKAKGIDYEFEGH